MKQCPDNFPVPLITVEQTNSTNTHLREYCQQQPPEAFTTVVTHYQTVGRGQRGNSWESEVGKNLLFSFVLFPHFLEPRQQFLLSQVVSLSIKEVLDNYTDGITIKWPNDIYWCEHKISGILIENELMGSHICQSIAGVGININQQRFDSSAPNPVSLWQITRKEHPCLEILAQVMQRIKEYHDLLEQANFGTIATRYQEALFRKEGVHLYADCNGEFQATIVRIEPEGHLVLCDTEKKERKYAFKEVQYIIS